MRSIFEYIDYRRFLSDYYNHKKETSRTFSYRYFAEKAGLTSPSFLKHALPGYYLVYGAETREIASYDSATRRIITKTPFSSAPGKNVKVTYFAREGKGEDLPVTAVPSWGEGSSDYESTVLARFEFDGGQTKVVSEMTSVQAAKPVLFSIRRVADNIVVTSKELKPGLQAVIYDPRGRVVRMAGLKAGAAQLSIRDLAVGSYVVEVGFAKKRLSQKVIIVK